MRVLKFVDLFAGIGGFHVALSNLEHRCVFASEIDPVLRGVYQDNFPDMRERLVGDLTLHKEQVPKHDVLCAGFPCQPFSKSGRQLGAADKTRGTLFRDILDVLAHRRPRFVILENVGNFERHDGGRTWEIVRDSLEALEYNVRGTEHVETGGHGLISPHHLGYPHSRERFFIVASLDRLPSEPFPPADRGRVTSMDSIVQPKSELSETDRQETQLSDQQIRSIDHWNEFIQHVPEDEPLPSFPIWGDELWETYPYLERTPHSSTIEDLRKRMGVRRVPLSATRASILEELPSYARTSAPRFADWKIRFIRQNRNWLGRIRGDLPRDWIAGLREFPPSLRKFEWNCQGMERDLWKLMLQFRPSGLRAKRYTSCPALVAMTTTQIPILGPKRRFLTRIEGLRLQGFPEGHELPAIRSKAFSALGNAVHVKVVEEIASRLLGAAPSPRPR
ncbi:MAG: Modification methylase HhaI [Nitrospira sp.]|nr:Modification methylase HhaI [Nitrospira sp.]